MGSGQSLYRTTVVGGASEPFVRFGASPLLTFLVKQRLPSWKDTGDFHHTAGSAFIPTVADLSRFRGAGILCRLGSLTVLGRPNLSVVVGPLETPGAVLGLSGLSPNEEPPREHLPLWDTDRGLDRERRFAVPSVFMARWGCRGGGVFGITGSHFPHFE